MAADPTLEPQGTKRSWVVLLYFYVVALVGLVLVVTGVTMALFGAKSALFPELGLSRYSYEYDVVPQDPSRPTEPTEEQLQTARDRAIDERRSSGLDGMLSGVILAGVGAPVLIWHLKRGRALSAWPEKPGVPTPPLPAPTEPPAAS